MAATVHIVELENQQQVISHTSSRRRSPVNYLLAVLIMSVIALVGMSWSSSLPIHGFRLSWSVTSSLVHLAAIYEEQDGAIGGSSSNTGSGQVVENLATTFRAPNMNDHHSASSFVLAKAVERTVRNRKQHLQKGNRQHSAKNGHGVYKSRGALRNESADFHSTNNVLDIHWYDLDEPFFGNLVSSGLSEAQTIALLSEVTNIWKSASQNRISLRFHRRKLTLDRDRAAAYLFFIVGHPRVAPTRPETQTWISHPLSEQLDHLEPLLNRILASSSMVRLLERKLLHQDSTDPDGRRRLENKAKSTGGVTRRQFTKMLYMAFVNPGEHGDKSQEVVEGLVEAFDGLIGEIPTEGEAMITAESFRDFLSVRDKPEPVRRMHLAFRLFYVKLAGITMRRVFEFAEITKERPMLFMQYAIGRDRDLITHSVARGLWEFQNTLSVYPVPYYHDLNGRGSQNWMDVIFRTASCWDRQNRELTLGGINFGPFACRWGVRKWERHLYTTRELGRMIAHEIGHCVGLGHVQPHCLVYPSTNEANLMQQQRNIGLRQWEGHCACLASSPSCGECRCPMDEDNFLQVGEARHLDDRQIEIAVEHVRRRDYLETQAPGIIRVGPRVVTVPASDSESPRNNDTAITLEDGDVLVLLNWTKTSPLSLSQRRSAPERKVTQLSIRAYSKSIASLKLSGYPEESCKYVIDSLRDVGRVTEHLPSWARHFEWPELEAFQLLKGESLAIEFKLQSEDQQFQIARAISDTESQPVCILRRKSGSAELLHVNIQLNFGLSEAP